MTGKIFLPTEEPEFYKVEDYEKLGEGMMVSILDFKNINCSSRIPNTEFKNFTNL